MTEAVLEKRLTGAESVVWDLSILYSGIDDPKLQQDIDRCLAMADEFAAKYRGRVATMSAAEIVTAIEDEEAIYDLGGRPASFAYLMFSTDTADPQRGALVQKIQENGALLAQKMMFFSLEWKDLDDAQAQAILDQVTTPKYHHALEADRRFKPYTLSEPVEQALVEKEVTGSSAWARFFTQMISSLRFDLDGAKLTQTQTLSKLYEPDRSLRQRAADAVTATLKSRSMELTYIFNVLAADKASDDRMRGYPTWISARNLANKAPNETVEALIQAVTSNYEICARHYRLKRRILGYDALYDYDRYAPIRLDAQGEFYSWDEARAITESAYSRFNGRVGDVVRSFFDESWIHAAVAPNKQGGAYASPTVPSAHPFVFVNYLGKARDVMTLAHELGHGLHMFLGGRANGASGLYTPLTTAEMASTFGEMLVFDDLMAKETSPATQLELLLGKIEDSFATIFRQIAMNRFEEAMHTARRQEGELTTERLSQLWMETQRAQFGDSVILRDEYSQWWSYVPHFLHTPGYVYAYSFGELLVLALFNLYKKRGAEFAGRYVEVLEAGNTDYPENILAKVGVDLRDPAFWNEGLQTLSAMVDQEEALARQVFPEKF
ncbi:MAG: M3 family oligoendopeptidase [Anaerolineae bacterium]|nr:M3 family oligoendopeptidase [Anaerolineae bacterium]